MIFLLFLASVIGLRLVLSKDPAPAVQIAIEPVLQNAAIQNLDMGSDLSQFATALQQWGTPTAPAPPSHPASPQAGNLIVDSKSAVRPN